MAYQLNEKVKSLKPYDPICGDYKIRLDANESFIFPSQSMKEEIAQVISNFEFNRYPNSLATDVCEKFAKLYNIPQELVVAGNGSDEIISIIMTAFLQKGDKIITLSPDFSMYKFYSSLVECECFEFSKDENFNVDFNKLVDTISREKARMVIFSNPCNPTSVGFKKEDILNLVENTDALVVLDEAYMDFWNQSLLSNVQDYNNLIILKTCSKALGFAAVRLGFAVANKTLTDIIKAAKSPYNVNSLTQAIGSIVLDNREYVEQSIQLIVKSKEMLYSEIKKIESQIPQKIKLYESDTNFVFIKTQEATDIFEYLKSNGIIIRNMNGYLRITAGTEDENRQVVDLIKRFYKVG